MRPPFLFVNTPLDIIPDREQSRVMRTYDDAMRHEWRDEEREYDDEQAEDKMAKQYKPRPCTLSDLISEYSKTLPVADQMRLTTELPAFVRKHLGDAAVIDAERGFVLVEEK